ncbi:unnamed protein product [Owenia fusiformis]|uniref:Uncharacterized protein n=1 Tax=Owenia fusiformis TaxID=6347 RepID=A0A8S4MZL3_OWEFU|nr:unnamed protein product [Owenia fusiformis]
MDLLKVLCCLSFVIVGVYGQESIQCLDGPWHKKFSGPEGPDYVECLSWKDNACCLANMTQELLTHKAKNLYDFHWDRCGNLSQACETFIKDEECFYQCEPGLRKFRHDGPKDGRITKVPVCKSYCDDWFNACKDDMTCVENWMEDFDYTKGENHCPADSTCKTFADMYGNAEGLCNKMWGHAFTYSTDSSNCMVMSFDPTNGNPNAKFISKLVANIYPQLRFYRMDGLNDDDNVSKGGKRKREDSPETFAPRAINILEYAEARGQEIEAMTKVVMDTNLGKRRIIQQLPRHMRRRAMSHNIKRIPRRLRNIAQSQMGPVKTTKRPSRRHRRRPHNLLQEYNRRQRSHGWLETHIWHAKRFHMTEKWGYKIPLRPTDKGTRAAYRASVKHAMVQDLSYYTCIEVKGKEEDILAGVQQLSSPETGLTFAARATLYGQRQGHLVLYKPNCYPYSAIGPVTFLWKPTCKPDNECNGVTQLRQLWITCHPAMYNQLLLELWAIFDISADSLDQEEGSSKNSDVNETSANQMVSPGIIKVHENQKWTNKNGVTVTSLKDKFTRLRLTGFLAHSVVKDLLKGASLEKNVTNKEDNLNKPVVNKEPVLGDSDINMEPHVQSEPGVWEKCQSVNTAGELPPNCVLGLVARDPRLTLPQRRTKVMGDAQEISTKSYIDTVPVECAVSSLWDEDVRRQVATNKLPDSEINRRRAEHLVPGSELNLGEDEPKIPLLLVNNPGTRATQSHAPSSHHSDSMQSIGSGWDIILPAGWAMPFWLATVFRGARAVGMDAMEATSAEHNTLHFPNDYPDTLSCFTMKHEQKQLDEIQYGRYPKNKRPNYFKLGVPSPFVPPWNDLVSGYSKEVIDANMGKDNENKSKLEFSVLRHKKQLQAISLEVETSLKSGKSGTSVLDTLYKQNSTSLVCVNLHIVLRGTPSDNSAICIPTLADLQSLKSDSKYGGPLETAHKDPRDNHKNPLESVGILPKVENVINHCSRKCIGYVNKGGYSLSNGSGVGMGFCSIVGLSELCKFLQDEAKQTKCIVLVRSPVSLQYRFAYLSIRL